MKRDRPDGDEERGERRWPMALAVIVAIVLTALLPSSIRPISWWALSVTGLLLIGLIIADPGRIDRTNTAVRVLSRALLSLLAVTAAVTTVLLIHELIVGGKLTQSAGDLLAAGAAVWVANNIVFALLYWEIDGGGSAARALRPPEFPDLAFPQHTSPHLARPGWRPQFVDYLYLGFTNALAFSPTDVMPLAPWAKILMGLQSLVSLAILGLVVARAVNVLT
jgi:hypothetical protein